MFANNNIVYRLYNKNISISLKFDNCLFFNNMTYSHDTII